MGEKTHVKWIILIILSLVWGSSFILIKKALIAFNPIHLGALRIGISGLVLFFISLRHLPLVRRGDYPWLILAGLTGNFLPAFLFAYAQTELESGITAILNTLVPMFTLTTALLFFRQKASFIQSLGVLLGFVGAILIIISNNDFSVSSFLHAFAVILAAFFYAVNLNLVKWRLNHLPSLHIVSISFSFFILPCLAILLFTGFFEQLTFSSTELEGFIYVIVLSVVGTVLALIMFYKLIKISPPSFSSSVGYLIPIVAVGWGILDGERFVLIQALFGLLILFGIYLARK